MLSNHGLEASSQHAKYEAVREGSTKLLDYVEDQAALVALGAVDEAEVGVQAFCPLSIPLEATLPRTVILRSFLSERWDNPVFRNRCI